MAGGGSETTFAQCAIEARKDQTDRQMNNPAGTPEITTDHLLDGRLSLKQPRRGHRAGTDAVLLAATVAAIPARNIADVGAASGAIGLMLGTAQPRAEVVFIEQDATLAELCGQNIRENKLTHGRVANADIFDKQAVSHADIRPDSFDLVVTNPPFLEEGTARLSPDANRRKAHALPEGGLALWIAFCARLVRGKGTLALIHRADQLRPILAALPADFGALHIRFIHPRESEPAIRVIVLATRGSKAPTSITPPLCLHGTDGAFTQEAADLHEGGWLAVSQSET